MGLDMYLYVERSCSYDDAKKTVIGAPDRLQKIVDIGESGFYPASSPKKVPLDIIQRYEIAYWRKAYTIHNYFVDKAACGDEEATLNYVPVDLSVLEQLQSKCEKVLAEDRSTHEYASEYLPDEDEEYGSYYYNQITYTLKILEELIPYYKECKEEDEKNGWNYHTTVMYSASW
jgi:hypothetical protein